MLRLIGLTGGIATGKTTVSNYLYQKYGLPVWDADLYACEAVQPGSPGLTALVDRYGSGILNLDLTLNRSQLGEIIFAQAPERQWVEQQIHPIVRRRFQQNIKLLQAQAPANSRLTAVLAIPLLFEARMSNLVTEIWVVYCSPDQQLQRLLQRQPTHLTPDQAQARISSQMPLAEKCSRADLVLNNTSTLNALYDQVDRGIEIRIQKP
ncbi:MAG: dephospho-CoA kinase [Oscillatoriales cyanobacterium RM1_1_9]|nr:dephospho-CoA kinase [Oscillatoriales cyanobacterium SM2_3_0]NJO46809.1 dephospho-CoA kinase [Oscillatoriales cyanobacterium RM2_1_1]NJO72009.1 dephospho-CoA kinase [Oscillatoriales cyanobacterium RM1_1_9]